jgi:cytidine deaminase
MIDPITQTMFNKAIQTMAKAHVPYSNFHVGACLLADDGKYYTGCNIENVSYRVTVCAEQCAISNMIAHGGKHIKEMVIVAEGEKIISPCGACRQMILEFAEPATKIYMFNENSQMRAATIAELLPGAFDKEFLARK